MRKLLLISLVLLISGVFLTTLALAKAAPEPKYIESQWGFISATGELVLKQVYTGLGPLVDGLAPVQLGEKQGYINLRGEVVIKAKYAFADVFSEGLARVNVGGELNGQYPVGGKWGFIDNKGRHVVDPKYEWAEPFSGGLAKVVEKGEIKFLNKQGTVEFTLGHSYNDTGNFSGGFTWVRSGENTYYYMDQQKRVTTNISWRTLPGQFSEGLAVVSSDGKDGYIDTNLKVVIPYRYEVGGNFSGGLARVRINGKWGFIDKKGTLVIPCEYDFAESFSGGLARVRVDGKTGYINTLGNFVIPPQYADGLSFSGGLAAVYVQDKGWGFVNTKGQLVIAPQYAAARSFSSGVAQVATASGWGYVNEVDEVVIPPQFDDAQAFNGSGVAQVMLNGQLGWINEKGQMVVPAEYSGVSGWVNNNLAVTLTNDWKSTDTFFYSTEGSRRTFAEFLRDNAKHTYLLQDTYSVMATALNMRKSAELKAEKVMTIPGGVEVKMLEKTNLALSIEGIDGHWAKVEYDGKTGYVYDGFLTRLPAVRADKGEHYGINDYFEEGVVERELYEIGFPFAENQKVFIQFAENGIVKVETADYTSYAFRMYYYVPDVSVREVYLLARILFPEEQVTKVNDVAVTEKTLFKNLILPDTKHIKLEFLSEWTLTIDEEMEGYIMVSPYRANVDTM